jgi:hypothetical protein
MNLIQQLQATPKWKEFKEWYNTQGYFLLLEGKDNLDVEYTFGFDDLAFEFQKGVFEKFIESQGYIIEQWLKEPLMMASLFERKPGTRFVFEGTFEELLIWYFNN